MELIEREDGLFHYPAKWRALESRLAVMQEMSGTSLAPHLVSSLNSLCVLRNNLTRAVWQVDTEGVVEEGRAEGREWAPMPDAQPGARSPWAGGTGGRLGDVLVPGDLLGPDNKYFVLAWHDIEPFGQDLSSFSPKERARAIRLAFRAWLGKLLRLVGRAIAVVKREVARSQFAVSFVVVQRRWHTHHGAHPPDTPDIGSVDSTQRPGAYVACI